MFVEYEKIRSENKILYDKVETLDGIIELKESKISRINMKNIQLQEIIKLDSILLRNCGDEIDVYKEEIEQAKKQKWVERGVSVLIILVLIFG